MFLLTATASVLGSVLIPFSVLAFFIWLLFTGPTFERDEMIKRVRHACLMDLTATIMLRVRMQSGPSLAVTEQSRANHAMLDVEESRLKASSMSNFHAGCRAVLYAHNLPSKHKACKHMA
jgi:hypothetical protein